MNDQKQRSTTPKSGYDRYKKGSKLGEGTFGVVHKGDDLLTGETVAMKKIKLINGTDQGISPVALREVKMLRELHHPNILRLVDVFSHHSTIYLIFEMMESNLEQVIKDRNLVLTAAHIKSFLQQTLSGLSYCHKSWILHRDLTPSNLLLSDKGVLKLADFGLARTYASPEPRYTSEVVTIWYRAPELLYGSKKYTFAVDIWAVGCIFAEMMLRTPYFPGDSAMDQLSRIFSALGTPSLEQWPGMTSLPDYVEFNPCQPTPFDQLFTAANEEAINLLSQMLKFDPGSRIPADLALEHSYFRTGPTPTPPHLLPLPRASTKRPLPPVDDELLQKKSRVLFQE